MSTESSFCARLRRLLPVIYVLVQVSAIWMLAINPIRQGGYFDIPILFPPVAVVEWPYAAALSPQFGVSDWWLLSAGHHGLFFFGYLLIKNSATCLGRLFFGYYFGACILTAIGAFLLTL